VTGRGEGGKAGEWKKGTGGRGADEEGEGTPVCIFKFSLE